jgi:immunity protein 21 of polymorphic toxin system
MLGKRESGLVWMWSNGGPLLLIPGEYLSAWEGCESPSGGRRVEATFRWDSPDSPATDYDRAGDVDDYLGLLDIGAGHGLVLGGEHAGAMWRPRTFSDPGGNERAGGILVRCVYADSDEHVIEVLQRIPEDIWADEGMVFTVGPQPLYLIDSAFAGYELGGDDHLIIQLPAGQYAAATAVYQPDRSTSLVLHRLALHA